jgi:hypothetical protein
MGGGGIMSVENLTFQPPLRFTTVNGKLSGTITPGSSGLGTVTFAATSYPRIAIMSPLYATISDTYINYVGVGQMVPADSTSLTIAGTNLGPGNAVNPDFQLFLIG